MKLDKKIKSEIVGLPLFWLWCKRQPELSNDDKKLRHNLNERISIDLDDGVKVNYGNFGDLLAEVKNLIGKAPNLEGEV